jgi:hypothetical protein
MTLTRIRAPFDHPDFLYEWKADGFQALVYLQEAHCELVPRSDRATSIDIVLTNYCYSSGRPCLLCRGLST